MGNQNKINEAGGNSALTIKPEMYYFICEECTRVFKKNTRGFSKCPYCKITDSIERVMVLTPNIETRAELIE